PYLRFQLPPVLRRVSCDCRRSVLRLRDSDGGPMPAKLRSTGGMFACGPPAGALLVALIALPAAVQSAGAAEATASAPSIEQQVQALTPSLADYIAASMKSFDVPGPAIGIVAGNKLVYAKGFGVRSKGGAPVDAETIFQIGSVTKSFLSATM